MSESQSIQRIPDFRLPASTGQTLERASFLDKVSMVFAFVVDLEAHGDQALIEALNERLRRFGERRAQALVVVKRTAKAVRTFSDQKGVNLPILADASGSLRRAFGVGDHDRVIFATEKNGDVISREDFDPVEMDAGDVVEELLALLARQ